MVNIRVAVQLFREAATVTVIVPAFVVLNDGITGFSPVALPPDSPMFGPATVHEYRMAGLAGMAESKILLRGR